MYKYSYKHLVWRYFIQKCMLFCCYEFEFELELVWEVFDVELLLLVLDVGLEFDVELIYKKT